MTDSIFRSTFAIPDFLAGRDPRSFGEQAESAMKQLWVGLFWGPTTIARVVVSVMIAQRWDKESSEGLSLFASRPDARTFAWELNRPFVPS